MIIEEKQEAGKSEDKDVDYKFLWCCFDSVDMLKSRESMTSFLGVVGLILNTVEVGESIDIWAWLYQRSGTWLSYSCSMNSINMTLRGVIELVGGS